MRLIPLILIILLIWPTIAAAQSKHVRDMQVIDAALPTAQITAARRAEVLKLRRQGERLHFSNQHGAAEVALERAKAILKGR